MCKEENVPQQVDSNLERTFLPTYNTVDYILAHTQAPFRRQKKTNSKTNTKPNAKMKKLPGANMMGLKMFQIAGTTLGI